MSSVEANKDVVRTFLKEVSARDYDTAFGMMTEDGTWEVPGDLPFSGTHSRLEIKGLFEEMAKQFASPVTWEATGMIGEGDAIAAECVSAIDTTSGKKYRNRYHMLFHLRDGQIARVVEYSDTKHVADVFLT